MIYAHIYNNFGQTRICYRKFFKFHDTEEDKRIAKNLIATISEPTGDDLFLAKQVVDYAEKEGLHIEGFLMSSVKKRVLEQVSALPAEDKIEMLEISVRNLVALWERDRRELAEIRAKLKQLQDRNGVLIYALEVTAAIELIAEGELCCEHIQEARDKYWNLRKQTDC